MNTKIVHDNEVINTFILTAPTGDFIIPCLKSLFDTTDMKKHRVIVVLPTTKKMELQLDLFLALQNYADIVIITGHNYGFDQCVNLGIANVRSDYFTVIHDDLLFQQKGWWDICQKEFEQDEKIIMVQPCETPVKFAPKEDNEITNIYCMVFKREFKEVIGLFDERWYPAGPEDVDLLFRIKNAGYRTWLSYKAVVWHKGSGTVGQYANYDWDRSKEYVEMQEKYGVPTQSKYDHIPKQLQPDLLKQL